MLDNMPRGTICIEDIEMGMTRHLRKVVTDRDIELFAEVSTDRNPVHLDDDYARDTIFEGRIAHGMLTAGLISAVIGEQLARPWHGLYGAKPEIPWPRAPRRHGPCRG
jgi:3-hydroxybutyryl-CoA dehydratase